MKPPPAADPDFSPSGPSPAGPEPAGWIITVGDELINGVRVDTNTAWLAERLEEYGVRVTRALSVGDDEAAIGEAVAEALATVPLVIVSGGLGPTADDRTKQALADLFGVPLTRRPEVEEAVVAFFATRGRAASPVNLDQALVPEGFEAAVNPRGTAPGMLRRSGGQLLFVLPGVPGEMKALMRGWVEPVLAAEFAAGLIVRRRWFCTTGIGESDLYDSVGDLAEMAPALSLAYLPSPQGTALYLTARGEDEAAVEAALAAAAEHITRAAGEYLYACGNISLAEYLADLFTREELTLATAESCTGGMIAAELTAVAGASAWFRRGWVTYSDEAKSDDLGVPAELIAEHGAVSEPVARAMATGARQRAQSDWSLAVTGIAGPTGERPGKPIGLTFVACAGPDGVVVRRYLFGGSERRLNRSRARAVALDLLRRMVTGLDPERGGWETPRKS